MSKFDDMTGKKFGSLTVLGEAGRDKHGHMFLLCRCDCGTEKAVKPSALRSGRSKTCGCGRLGGKHNLAGLRFGTLTVASECGRNAAGAVTWRCVCDCGGEREVASSRLLRGEVNSCGCRNANRTHGGYGTSLYARWRAMIRRCENPNVKAYADYGGRGITVCSRWRQSFEAFACDMGPSFSPELTMDRIDVNGNYEPGNVRWATPKQQTRNRRTTRHLTFHGRTLALADWAELLGLQPSTIRYRLNKAGWSVDRALTEGADREALSALKKERHQ